MQDTPDTLFSHIKVFLYTFLQLSRISIYSESVGAVNGEDQYIVRPDTPAKSANPELDGRLAKRSALTEVFKMQDSPGLFPAFEFLL